VQQNLAVLSPGCLLLAIQDHPPLNNTCVNSWEIGLVVKIKKKNTDPISTAFQSQSLQEQPIPQ
jgi:hypothetical protein